MRHLLLIFLLVLAGTLAQAQRFKAALVAGLNMAQIDGDDLAGYHQPGANAGIRTSALLSDKWQLGVELLFSQQGSDRVPDELNGAYDNIRLNMVEVPVFLQYSEWKFQVAAGISYSRLVNARIVETFGSNETRAMDNNSIGITLGGTYFLSERWGIDARWTRAFHPLNVQPKTMGNPIDQFLSYFVSFRLLYFLN